MQPAAVDPETECDYSRQPAAPATCQRQVVSGYGRELLCSQNGSGSWQNTRESTLHDIVQENPVPLFTTMNDC
jgi:hypothetical protein